jgi:hypothetical protein
VLCSFVDTLRAVIIDVRWFLILLLITLFGFAGVCAATSTLPQSNCILHPVHATLCRLQHPVVCAP